MKKYLGIIAIFFCLFIRFALKGQDNSIRPQLWNNLYLVKNINEKLAFRNALAFNVLLSNDYPWNEYSYSGAVSYDLKPWINGSAGLYLSSTRQSENLTELGYSHIYSQGFQRVIKSVVHYIFFCS